MKIRNFLNVLNYESRDCKEYELQIEIDTEAEINLVDFKKDDKNKIFTVILGCKE
jgi:hypothetical protein